MGDTRHIQTLEPRLKLDYTERLAACCGPDNPEEIS